MTNKIPKALRFERFFDGSEIRALEPQKDSGTYSVDGHAIVYEQKTNVGGWFEEVVKRGALEGADLTDVPLFVHHNRNKIPLARSRRNKGNSTMTLTPDSQGLFFLLTWTWRIIRSKGVVFCYRPAAISAGCLTVFCQRRKMVKIRY